MILASTEFSQLKVSFTTVMFSVLLKHEQLLTLCIFSLSHIMQSNAEKRFLYDIVANGRNGIDVDK